MENNKQNETCEFIEATNYIHRGGWILLRQGLLFSDSESWQSLWVAKYGSIVDFPWEELYGKCWRETRDEYVTKAFIISREKPTCPHCREPLF